MKQILNVAQLDPRSIYNLFGREVNAVFVLCFIRFFGGKNSSSKRR
jgi:hypothetical protein